MDEPGRIFAGKTEIFGKYRKRNWSLGLQSDGLAISADEHPFLCPDGAPAVGSELKPLTALLLLRIH